MHPKTDAATRIEQVLVRELLQGEYPHGSRLPTVRELALRFGVNAATVQRALARLEGTGLVTARRGSGIHVEDPALVGELPLAPALLEAGLDDPEESRRVLEQFLDIRRGLMVSMMIEHRASILAGGATLLAAAAELEQLDGADTAAKFAADAAFSRQFVKLAGNNLAVAWLHNTALRMVERVPHLADAYYEDLGALRAANLQIIQALMSFEQPGDLWVHLDAALRAMDEGIAARFERRLRQPVGEMTGTE